MIWNAFEFYNTKKISNEKVVNTIVLILIEIYNFF
jgi:hypothetical protein